MSHDTKKSEVAIEVFDLTVAYDIKPVLWDIDLLFRQGKSTAIVGPNGAGKSTLIKAMLGMIRPVTGAVHFYSESGLLQRNQIAYVPQSTSIDWDFPITVFDVVLMGRYGHLGWVKRPGKKDKDLTIAALEKVGMQDFRDRQISELSGGQQQRAFLARAFAQEAKMYLMDEPFKGVDAHTETVIVGLLKEITSSGNTIVLVHHDLNTVADYFDEVCLINKRIIEHGPVEEIFNEQNINRTYGRSSLLKASLI
jgi:manganese/zinc/iron transport system ATP- binding protein